MFHPYAQMVNNGMTHMMPGMPQQYYGAGQLPLPGTNNNATGFPYMSPYMSPYMTHPGLIPTTSAYPPSIAAGTVAPGFPAGYAPTNPTQIMPHTPIMPTPSVPAVYENFGYEPLNAKLAVPSALPSGITTAEQNHLAAFSEAASAAAPGLGSQTSGLSLSSTLSSTIAGQRNMVPVRLPNGMIMQIPRDELSSMPNAIPTYNLPSMPSSTPLSSEWQQKLAAAQSNIAAQQAQYSQYSDAAYQSVAGKEQESEMLQTRLQALQKNLLDAKHATEMQKEWLDQVAR
jgi:hypothetical protein